MTENDTEILEPRQETVIFNGRDIVITPLKAAKIIRFGKMIAPIFPQISEKINSSNGLTIVDITNLFFEHGEILMQSSIIAVDEIEDQDMEEVDLDEFIVLLMTIYRINHDFFIKKVLPSLQAQEKKIIEMLGQKNGDGTTHSNV